MADCMECDDDIDWDVDVCPHCGLDAPVARKWYVDLYGGKVNAAKEVNDWKALARLYWQAYFESGMFPDPYVFGDMARALEEVYLKLNFHEALIYLYVEDVTHPEYFGCIENSARKAYLHAVEYGREDLELYIMNSIDGVRQKYAHKGTPEDLVERKMELSVKEVGKGIAMFEYPMMSADMWDDFPLFENA